MRRSLMIFGLLLAACGTQEGFDEFLGTWVGRSAEELQAVWGPPQQITPSTDDSQVFTYFRNQGTWFGITTPQSIDVGPARRCVTNFFIDDTGRITDVVADGPGCLGPPNWGQPPATAASSP